MTDDIQTLTARLAADPESLAFLPLGEALRRRGQLDSALAVAQGGAERYPALADAYDLLGRIRSDRGEGDLAFDGWTEALRLDPTHLGALRGLAFLAFRAADYARAERHLERAVSLAPTDSALRAALDRVRERRRAAPPSTLPPFRADAADTLFVDGQGRRLAGIVRDAAGSDVSDAVAAELAGVCREAERTARLLEFGTWLSLAAECAATTLHLVPPTAETILLLSTDPGTPAGRIAREAERAAAAARRWLEHLR